MNLKACFNWNIVKFDPFNVLMINVCLEGVSLLSYSTSNIFQGAPQIPGGFQFCNFHYMSQSLSSLPDIACPSTLGIEVGGGARFG